MCVERAMNMFFAQDYIGDKELIIFNTDEEYPYKYKAHTFPDVKIDLEKLGVKVINNGIDYVTGKPYTNVGAVRRDALTHATGTHYVCWDDDDIFLDWFFRQSVDRMAETGLPSFKPAESMFHYAEGIKSVRNVLEASICSDIKLIRKYGFGLVTALEGLSWYTAMRDNGELVENDYHMIPHYCFNWGDGEIMKSGHKQSGAPDNPDNFENHKAASTDMAINPLRIYSKKEMDVIYKPYLDFLNENRSKYDNELFEKYVLKTGYGS
jgi:hypothetical protein